MEFRFKNVCPYNDVVIRPFFTNLTNDTEIAFIIFHNNRTYSSIDNDILYMFNTVRKTLSRNDYLALMNIESPINKNGIKFRCQLIKFENSNINMAFNALRYDEMFAELKEVFKNGIYMKEPEDENNIVTIETVKEVIQYVDREIIQKVPVVVALEEIEVCFICSENKAIVSFGCCSINYCPKCAITIAQTKPQCSQCRKSLDIKKIVSLVK